METLVFAIAKLLALRAGIGGGGADALREVPGLGQVVGFEVRQDPQEKAGALVWRIRLGCFGPHVDVMDRVGQGRLRDHARREGLASLGVAVQGRGDLLQVVAASHAAGGLARCLHRRQQQRGERGDDEHDHQQFDERKGGFWISDFGFRTANFGPRMVDVVRMLWYHFVGLPFTSAVKPHLLSRPIDECNELTAILTAAARTAKRRLQRGPCPPSTIQNSNPKS